MGCQLCWIWWLLISQPIGTYSRIVNVVRRRRDLHSATVDARNWPTMKHVSTSWSGVEWLLDRRVHFDVSILVHFHIWLMHKNCIIQFENRFQPNKCGKILIGCLTLFSLLALTYVILLIYYWHQFHVEYRLVLVLILVLLSLVCLTVVYKLRC